MHVLEINNIRVEYSGEKRTTTSLLVERLFIIIRSVLFLGILGLVEAFVICEVLGILIEHPSVTGIVLAVLIVVLCYLMFYLAIFCLIDYCENRFDENGEGNSVHHKLNYFLDYMMHFDARAVFEWDGLVIHSQWKDKHKEIPYKEFFEQIFGDAMKVEFRENIEDMLGNPVVRVCIDTGKAKVVVKVNEE